ICVHHMICDGWSVNLLVQDLFRFYEQGRIEDDPPGAFIDVLGWQEGLLSGPQGDEGLAFWSDTLAGAPEEVTLPVARPRPPVQTFNGSSVPIALAADRLDRLRALAADCGATPYTVLLAAFRVLLHRYSGEGDVPVGTVMAGRRPVFEKTVGYFVNPVVLRTAVDGDLTGRDLIARVRETLHQALEHQNIPFPLLVERLHPRRNPARTPLFQIAFGLTKLAAETDDGFIDRPDPAHGFPAGSLRVLPFILPQQEGQFDLNLEFFETPERLFGRLNFNTDLFDPGVAARLAGHFDTLLSSLLDTPEAPVGTLPMLSAEELDGLDAWDALSARVPDPADFAGRTIHGLVAEQAARTPNATAVDPGDGGLTYADLEARANRLARHIAAAGVAPRGLVAVYLGRGPDMVVAVLAALKAGCAYLPVDPAYPADRVAFMLADSGAPVVVTDGAHVSALPPDAPRVLDLSAETAAIAAHPDTAPDTGVGEDDLAYVIYTSGSTGKPKGVMIPHRAACNRLRWKQRALDVGPADRVLQAIAYSFDPSVWEIFTPLIAGGCIVLPPPDIQRDPAAMAALMRDRGVTAFSCVPSLLQHLVDQPDFARIDTLRHVICGGESLPAPLAATFYQRTTATLDHFYGPTEATIYATHWPCPRDGSDGGKIPIGRPVAHAVVRILDGGGQPTPVGVPGELFIGGEGLARGYLNRPDLTETRFLPDPFAETPGARLYRTGDLGRFREDGAIEFLGRVDTQVKVRGFRVELEEVEVHLKACPGLRDAAVAARGPSGAERLVAYVVPNGDGTPVDAGAIRAFMLKRLPDYMVPGQVMALDALPLSPNGKVDRAALPQLDRQAANGGAEKVPPRDALETSLVRIWEDILDVRPVGIHDNFFDLGGHSLMALRIQTRIEKALAVTVPATALFETPTVAALAERLRRRQDSASARLLVEVQPAGDRRPFFCVAAGHGDVMRFASLSQHMGTGRPFMALVPPRGPDGKPPRLVLTDLAAEYVDEILTVQRDGPFLIAGFSLGGVVALEVARQITARGHRVGAMVLLDTVHPSWTRGSLMLFRAVKAFITRFGFGKDTVFSRWLKTIFTDPGLEGQLEAMGRHRVTPYPGPATLVMSKSNARWRWLLFRPWSAKVTALRITRIVDGWHGRMFREPYVTDLAGILNDSLDGAESGDGPSPRIH
ncbi:MAG: amino acid adenylation domain-containing protein, partial [Rhodobacterales bacterium]|nr:amino acid adenylation domain-containing protein [Rhodobacterales bacterium]